MGPIAGLAAGLGIAALMSHLGLGAEFGNIIMMVLLAVAAFVADSLPDAPFHAVESGGGQRRHAARGRRRARSRSAADVVPRRAAGAVPRPAARRGAALGRAGRRRRAACRSLAPMAAASLPAGFDAAAFERIAKMIFIRMQAANDSADLNDLRAFTTPEMFAAIKLDLQERGGKAQRTDVVRVDAEVLDVASEAERQIVSVRFHGLIREEEDGVAEPFDEVWHLVKPADGSREWAIAGIQQTSPALA